MQVIVGLWLYCILKINLNLESITSDTFTQFFIRPKINFMKKIVLSVVICFCFACNSDNYKLEWKIEEEHPLCYALYSQKLTKDEVKCLRDSFFNQNKNTCSNNQKFKSSHNLTLLIVIENDGEDCYEYNCGFYNGCVESNDKKYPRYINVLDYLATFQSNHFEPKTKITSSGRLCDNDKSELDLVTLLCQLPEKKVAIGDKWEVKIRLPKEVQDGLSEKSRYDVRLDSIEEFDNNIVAHIFYDISLNSDFEETISGETINSHMSYDFFGRAKFDITKGRCLYIEGVMINKKDESGLKEKYNFLQFIEIPGLSETDLKIVDIGIDEKRLLDDDFERKNPIDYYTTPYDYSDFSLEIDEDNIEYLDCE